MEELVDTVTAVCADDTAVLLLGDLFDNVAKLANQDTGFDRLDGLIQTLSCRFDDTNIVGVSLATVTDVVCLVKVGVVALVVERDINVEDVPVQEDTFIRNAMADDFVDRRTT